MEGESPKKAHTSTMRKAPASAGKLSVSSRPEVDFTKEWKNGHKTFDSSQVRALDELINTEIGIRERYDTLRGQIKKPRNPLVGEPTPRDAIGNVVMNPSKFHTVQNGMSLFSKEQLDGTAVVRSPVKKELTGKIGVVDSQFAALGNTGSPARSDNMFDTVAYVHAKKQHMKDEQRQLSEYVAREKAKRYQVQLQREIAALHRTAEEKASEIDILRAKYSL